MSDIFISYARDNQPEAQRFVDALKAAGYKVWWDTALHAGESFDMRIEAAIKAAKAVVVLWSEKSVSSRWVRAEATMADRLGKLVPVRIGPCDLPIMFELTHTEELTNWQGESDTPLWQRFLESLSEVVGATPEIQTTAPVVTTPAKPSVLVLPFSNMSRDPEQEYFADGMTEDIITDLGKISALSVISRRTAFNYKSHTISNAELRDLGVTHTVEGSIRKSGDRIRVTAQLTRVGTDEQLWGERFDRTLDDIFAIQDEISEAIVKALQLTLAPDEKNALERKPTQNTEAYDLYVLARQFSRTGSERMQPIIERLCQRAVELDPLFAEAWAMIAFARAEMHQRNVQEGMADDGRSAAEKAIELNPDLADGHSAMAEVMIRGDTLDFRLAEPYIDRAFELDPDSYTALMQSGYIGIMTGNFQHAIDVYERACAQDPNAYRAAGMIVQAYKGMGDEEGVERSCQRVIERCERLLAVEPDHGGALGFYITALIKVGEEERAKSLATRAEIFHPDNIRMLYNIACGFSEAGDLEPALRLLRRVLDKASRGWIEWMGRDNSLDPIREAPQYKALIAEALTRLDSQ